MGWGSDLGLELGPEQGSQQALRCAPCIAAALGNSPGMWVEAGWELLEEQNLGALSYHRPGPHALPERNLARSPLEGPSRIPTHRPPGPRHNAPLWPGAVAPDTDTWLEPFSFAGLAKSKGLHHILPLPTEIDQVRRFLLEAV